jgi:metal-responsive CopG/Arc/MetJ family transcriptional regulator
MGVHVTLPEELAAQIDDVSSDRTAFVTEAVRRLLHKSPVPPDETAKTNELADELNREASEVLEYQVIS